MRFIFNALKWKTDANMEIPFQIYCIFINPNTCILFMHSFSHRRILNC